MSIKEQAITEVIIDGQQAGQALKDLEKKADQLQEKLSTAFKANDYQSIKKLKTEIKDVDKDIRTMKTSVTDVDKVLKNMSGSSLRELQSAQKKLNAEFRNMKPSAAGYNDMQSNLKKLGTEITRVKGDLGYGTKALASLDSAASTLPGVFGRAAGAASGFITKIAALGPVGAIIGGGLLAIGVPLFAFFTQTEKGMDMMKEKVQGFKSAIAVLKGVLTGAGDKLVGKQEGPTLWGNFLKGLDIPKLEKLGDEMNDAAKEGERLAREFEDISDAERAMIVPREKSNTQIKAARLLYADATKSITERINALETALELEGKTADDELAIQKRKTQAIRNMAALELRSEHQVSDATDQMLQESLAKEEQLRGESDGRQMRALKSLQTARKELEKEEADKNKDILEKLIESIQKAYDDRIAVLKQNYINEKISREELERESLLADVVYLEAKKALFIKAGEDVSAIVKELQDKLIQLVDLKAKDDKIAADALAKANEESDKSIDQDYFDSSQSDLDALSEETGAELKIFEEKNAELKKLREEDLEDAKKKTEKQVDLAMQLGASIGELIGKQIAEGKLSIESFGKAILLSGLKVMKGILAQVIFESTVKNLVKLGPLGLIKAGLEIGLMEAAFAVMEAKLQMAGGHYPVKGPQDGKTYMAGYTGRPVTGIYDKPTVGLFSERMPEMVIDGPTTRSLQINRPDIINSIMSARVGQYAGGRYPSPGPGPDQGAGAGAAPGSYTDIPGFINTINRLNNLLDRGIEAKFGYNEVRNIRDRTNDITKIENRTMGK